MVLFIKEYLKNTEKIKKRKQVHINSASKTSPFLTIRWISSHRSITVVQSLSRVWFFVTTWTSACQASLSITNSRSPPKRMSIDSVLSSNHLILCRPLLLLPSIFPSIRSFQMSQLFTSGGQNIGVSVSASVLLMNSQDWFPLGLTGLISL